MFASSQTQNDEEKNKNKIKDETSEDSFNIDRCGHTVVTLWTDQSGKCVTAQCRPTLQKHTFVHTHAHTHTHRLNELNDFIRFLYVTVCMNKCLDISFLVRRFSG